MKKKAFTLIELLVVVAIIVLIGIFVVGIVGNGSVSGSKAELLAPDTYRITVWSGVNPATSYENALIAFKNEHPDLDIVSTVKTEEYGQFHYILNTKPKHEMPEVSK